MTTNEYGHFTDTIIDLTVAGGLLINPERDTTAYGRLYAVTAYAVVILAHNIPDPRHYDGPWRQGWRP